MRRIIGVLLLVALLSATALAAFPSGVTASDPSQGQMITLSNDSGSDLQYQFYVWSSEAEDFVPLTGPGTSGDLDDGKQNQECFTAGSTGTVYKCVISNLNNEPVGSDLVVV